MEVVATDIFSEPGRAEWHAEDSGYQSSGVDDLFCQSVAYSLAFIGCYCRRGVHVFVAFIAFSFAGCFCRRGLHVLVNFFFLSLSTVDQVLVILTGQCVRFVYETSLINS
jgi:hypothetical protein